MSRPKKIEIFCGTGGVGKTTTSASRAFYLAEQGRKVLLITIDPAKRLKQVLGIQDDQNGKVQQLEKFDVLLMSPEGTLSRIASESDNPKLLDNVIFQTLTSPHGGMIEILSIVELEHHFNKNIYDSIILDTAPGSHFIDFLQSCSRIEKFFDKTFIEIFNFLKKVGPKPGGFKIKPLQLLVETGIKKLLENLEKVTGPSFIEVFIETVVAIYQHKDAFTGALKFQRILKQVEMTNWFLVTSVDQNKIDQASDLKERANNFLHEDNYLIINKCLSSHLEKWDTEHHLYLTKLKQSMLNRESLVKQFASDFNEVFEFPEVLDPQPEEHVAQLTQNWEPK